MGRLKHQAMAKRDEALTATRIGDLLPRRIAVFCWCNRCGHNAVVDSGHLAAELGPALPVPDIGVHMRCSGCGSKDVATRPDWPSLGQVARHS